LQSKAAAATTKAWMLGNAITAGHTLALVESVVAAVFSELQFALVGDACQVAKAACVKVMSAANVTASVVQGSTTTTGVGSSFLQAKNAVVVKSNAITIFKEIFFIF